MRKRKNTIKKEKVRKTGGSGSKSISSDILLLFFGLVAIFFFLSLTSYSEADPGYSTIEFSKYNDIKPANLFGKTGAYVADFLGILFGWTALFIPFLSIYISILIYRYKKGLTFMMAPVLGFIYGMGVIISLSIISGLIGGIDFYFTKQPAGATMGALGSSFIMSLVGRVGGIIVFFVVTVAFSMLLFSISFSDMGHGFRVLFKYFKALFSVLKNIFNSKKKNNDTEEYEIYEDEDEVDEETIKERIYTFIRKVKKIFGIESKESSSVNNALGAKEQKQDKQAEQLLDKDELEAISSIQFISHNSEEISKDGNIIDIEPEQEKEQVKQNNIQEENGINSEESIEIRNAYEEKDIEEPHAEQKQEALQDDIEIRKM